MSRVAGRNNLSKGYLEQLAVSLKNAQLIRSTSGRTGGYRLGKPPEQISILEIFQATGGPVNVVECVNHPEDCMQSEFCRCRNLWELINHRITEVLADYSLKDLFDEKGKKRMSKELGLFDPARSEGATGASKGAPRSGGRRRQPPAG